MLSLTDLSDRLIAKVESWFESLVVMTPNLLAALVVVGLSIAAGRMVRRVAHRLLVRVTGNKPISHLLATTAHFSTVMLGFFFALELLSLDKTVTSLLAGVGVIGLALGFAFQDIAANFMSGFIMALNRPFDVGDLVDVSGHRGHVRQIALRASLIETLDGLSVLIPNKDIFQNPIINYTDTPYRRLEFAVGTAYCDDMETVRKVVLDALATVPARDPARDPELFFEEFGDSSISFRVRVWLNDAHEKAYVTARSEAMIAIKRALDANGLTIPFPIRTLDFGSRVVGGRQLDEMLGHAALPVAATQPTDPNQTAHANQTAQANQTATKSSRDK